MAVTAVLVGSVVAKAFNKEIDFDTDTIKFALMGSGFAIAQDTHDYFNDVSANELATANGYTAGGLTVTTKAITYDSASNYTVFDCDDPSWTASGTLTAYGAVLYVATGTASTSAIIGEIDFGGAVSATNDVWKYTVPAVSGGTGGMFRFTVA